MDITTIIDIADNVSGVFFLIIAVWWFNSKLEKADIKMQKADDKNAALTQRIFDLEKTYLKTIDRNTDVIEKMTSAIDDLKNEIKKQPK